jgi:hypothetical protein
MNEKPKNERGASALSTESSEFDALLKARRSQRTPEPSPAQASEAGDTLPQVIEADVDGRRVRVVAQDEIVLQCGSASITLRRNGRIVIKGTYIETCSEGTNRIKGGQVRIN